MPCPGKIPLDGCFGIELFCGTAGLTACIRTLFPDSFGVDHKVKQPKSQVICLDLQKPEVQKMVMQWASDPKCVWVHFGVPCGTASRARERRMSKTHFGPRPMRSKHFPDGLPPHLLTQNSRDRLRAANRLYLFMQKLILSLPATTVWTIENPLRSWLWQTSYFDAITQQTSVFFFQFDMCMFGGSRLKRTGIATNCEHLECFAMQCDDLHEHAPYEFRNGQFDIALEAEYPKSFCEALVRGVAEHLQKLHQWGPLDLAKRIKLARSAAVATNQQPKRMPQLVPEFERVLQILHVPRNFSIPLDAKKNTLQCLIFQCDGVETLVHCKNRMLRRTPQRGRASDGGNEVGNGVNNTVSMDLLQAGTTQSLALHKTQVDDKSAKGCTCCTNALRVVCDRNAEADEIIFGMYWSPEQFLAQVSLAGHPQHLLPGISESVQAAVDANVQWPYHDIVIHRCKWFGKYLPLAATLKDEETAISNNMPEPMRAIMRTKRIALLERILQDESYPDMALVQDLKRGFDLVGEIPTSGGVLPPKLVPATMAVEELGSNAGRAQLAMRTSNASSGDKDLDEKLYQKTLDEVAKGWLLGPLDWDSLEANAVVSKRFGLQQGEKLRPIDDYSMSSVNATVTVKDQATADNVDVICAMLLQLMTGLRAHGRSTLLRARSFDLAAAYRQLCIASTSKPFSYICVYNPRRRTNEVFSQICLPFGSKAAVNAFIRCSRCIQLLACKCLLLPTTCYYDDFVIATTPQLQQSSESTMCLLFEMLGWAYDKEGPKADTFSELVSALGVSISLSKTVAGEVEVMNTEKRKTDLVDLINSMLQKGSLQYKEGQVLNGKLAFAHGQIFGLAGKYVLQTVSDHIYAKPFKADISDDLRHALKLFQSRLLTGLPRSINMATKHTRFVLTDAFFEPDKTGGVGGVLCNPRGQVEAWFQFKMGQKDVQPFMSQHQENAIAELETLAVVLAMKLWAPKLCSQHVVFCLDNDVARFGLIKGYSNAAGVTKLVRLASMMCEECMMLPWFLRVASPSNIADFPSRLQRHFLLNDHEMVAPAEVFDAFHHALQFGSRTH